MVIPAALRRVITAQNGIVTRQQALDHGLSANTLDYAIGVGRRWQRVYRGVYATFDGPLHDRHRIQAALLLGGPSSMVSGVRACRAFGMRYLPIGPLLILVPHSIKRVSSTLLEFQRTRWLPEPCTVAGIATAPPARAVLDAVANVTDLRTVRAALCEVVQRDLTSPDTLGAVAARLQCDSANVHGALSDVASGCRSAPECELRDLIRTSTVLPEPEWNQPLPGISGPAIVPDGHWKRVRLALEVESSEWHRFGDRPEETERRRARIAANGWRVIPVSPRRLREEPLVVLQEIEAAYLAGVCQITRHGEV